MPQSSAKLTVYEWEGLSNVYNLADGHPRQTLLPVQRAVLADMASMFARAHHAHEPTAKQRFERAFFELAEQHSVLQLPPPLAQYSGSVAIELIVNYLRLQHMRVAFLHPSFDSLADTMRRHKVPLIPLTEETLYTLDETSPKLPVDAIYIVCPNNPTGKDLSRAQFERLVAYCKKYGLLLIVDFCFRFYSDL